MRADRVAASRRPGTVYCGLLARSYGDASTARACVTDYITHVPTDPTTYLPIPTPTT